MGIRERPKLAEARRASVERGGRPCLDPSSVGFLEDTTAFSPD